MRRQPIGYGLQNTCNLDAHRNGWVWQQNKGRSEGYAMWNKAKYTRNQQWREGNQDLNQRFGAEGRNKHATGTEWSNKNSEKWGEAEEPVRQL